MTTNTLSNREQLIRKWEVELERPKWYPSDRDEVQHWAYLMSQPAHQSLGVFHTLPSYERFCNEAENGVEELNCYICIGEPLRAVISKFTGNPADPTEAYNLDCGHTII